MGTELSKLFVSLGLLTNLDRAALAAYCSAYGQWMEVEQEIQKYSKIPESERIIEVLRRISSRQVNLMHSFLTEFGMTPAQRAKLFPEK